MTYLAQDTATALGVGWLEPATAAVGSLLVVNRSLNGLGTDASADDGASANLTPAFQTAVLLIHDAAVPILTVADNPSSPDNIYTFDESCTTCSVNVSGDTSGYSAGDVIAPSTIQGNMLAYVNTVGAGVVSFSVGTNKLVAESELSFENDPPPLGIT